MGRYLELLKQPTLHHDLVGTVPAVPPGGNPTPTLFPEHERPESSTTKTTETAKAPLPPSELGNASRLHLPLASSGEAALVEEHPDPELDWRIEAMRQQLRGTGPIPFLVAQDCPVQEGACLSCGVALAAEERYRCATCLKAAVLVLAAHRGGGSEDGERS